MTHDSSRRFDSLSPGLDVQRRLRMLMAGVWVVALLSSTKAADEPTPLTAEQRLAITKRLSQLEEKLSCSRRLAEGGHAAALDRWADVDVYRKGLRWALEFQRSFTAADVQLLNRSLDLGLARSEALAGEGAPWLEERGRVVHGYVSTVDGSTQPYGLIIPAGYDGQRPIRLDVVLHGSTRPEGLSELRFMDRFSGEPSAPAAEYIELHPLGRVENCYRWSGETDVFEAMEAVCRNYRIDRERIVLRGMSMGASGAWHLGLKHPDRFAALGPYCGYVDTHRFSQTPLPHFIRVPQLPRHQELALHMLDSVDYAANAGMVPAIAAMGEKDIFFDAHILMRDAMEKEGLTMVNLISPGTGHVIDPATHAEQLRRIAEHVRVRLERAPRRVRFVTWTLKYSRCHWVQILGLREHYRRAEIVASLVDGGAAVEVLRADNISRFAIDPAAFPRRPQAIRIDGQTVPVTSPSGRICLIHDVDRWQQVADAAPELKGGKRPELQGPIDDAFCSRFLCVRGTGRPWHPAVQAWADATLDTFADEWRRYFRGDLPVKRDTEVTADDVDRCHLVLFGDPGSNSWIARLLPQLPLMWTPQEVRLGPVAVSAADHVPVLIQPNPLAAGHDRYVVLNSGHTFHEAELAAVNYLLFPRLGDWAVLKVNFPLMRKTDPRVFADPAVPETGYCDEAWRMSQRQAETGK